MFHFGRQAEPSSSSSNFVLVNPSLSGDLRVSEVCENRACEPWSIVDLMKEHQYHQLNITLAEQTEQVLQSDTSSTSVSADQIDEIENSEEIDLSGTDDRSIALPGINSDSSDQMRNCITEKVSASSSLLVPSPSKSTHNCVPKTGISPNSQQQSHLPNIRRVYGNKRKNPSPSLMIEDNSDSPVSPAKQIFLETPSTLPSAAELNWNVPALQPEPVLIPQPKEPKPVEPKMDWKIQTKPFVIVKYEPKSSGGNGPDVKGNQVFQVKRSEEVTLIKNYESFETVKVKYKNYGTFEAHVVELHVTEREARERAKVLNVQHNLPDAPGDAKLLHAVIKWKMGTGDKRGAFYSTKRYDELEEVQEDGTAIGKHYRIPMEGTIVDMFYSKATAQRHATKLNRQKRSYSD